MFGKIQAFDVATIVSLALASHLENPVHSVTTVISTDGSSD